MASASSGIGTFIGGSAFDPASQARASGTDTQTLLIVAVAAVVILLLLRRK